jgi:hypothetical protein
MEDMHADCLSMTTALVREEIKHFLASNEAEVLCITGRWGVGKTYAWQESLRVAAGHRGAVALKRYAYVSLFGQNSLDDVRYALFESTKPIDRISEGVDSEMIAASLNSIEKVGRRSISFLKLVPALNAYLSNANRSFFLLVRDQIICLDDLERAGKGLTTKDVLGLISFLKEQRRCKVVMLLNDEAFDDVDGADFRTQLEKVADTTLEFSPSPAEAAAIAFNAESEISQRLRRHCETLGIVNIRVMVRIGRLAKSLETLLSGFDEGVLRQALHSIALFAWAVFQPEDAPSLEVIKSYDKMRDLFRDTETVVSDAEKSWRSLLKAYDFNRLEFDLVLLNGVERGAFEQTALLREATVLDKKFRHEKLDSSFTEAWALYHGSFDDNADAVLDALYEAFHTSVETISPVNLDSTLKIFKDLGRPEQANELLDFYMSNRQEKAAFFDLHAHPFGSEITDPDLRAAFASRFAIAPKNQDLVQTLSRIDQNQGWNDEDLEFLASASVSDFVRVFKQLRGSDLKRAIYTALQFGKYSNSSELMKRIVAIASDALREIARESTINARRVRTYGVTVDPPQGGAGKLSRLGAHGQDAGEKPGDINGVSRIESQ